MDAGWATLVELQAQWTLGDVFDACDALEALDRARADASRKGPGQATPGTWIKPRER